MDRLGIKLRDQTVHTYPTVKETVRLAAGVAGARGGGGCGWSGGRVGRRLWWETSLHPHVGFSGTEGHTEVAPLGFPSFHPHYSDVSCNHRDNWVRGTQNPSTSELASQLPVCLQLFQNKKLKKKKNLMTIINLELLIVLFWIKRYSDHSFHLRDQKMHE